MDVPGICRRSDIIDRARVSGVAHVDHGKALGEHMPDIGEAAMHHHLHAIGPAALIGMADNAHVACVIGFRQAGHLYASRKCGTAIQSSMAPSLCSRSCMRRSSSVLRLTPRCVPSLRPCRTILLPIGCRSALYALSAVSMLS